MGFQVFLKVEEWKCEVFINQLWGFENLIFGLKFFMYVLYKLFCIIKNY